ncbi:hypothetical protein BJ944DRAFT_284651 [Cunninghamella echinulata]|nr:hypothetical protein BJ944DRAFT_284651 [Cunninghamella echinulata]
MEETGLGTAFRNSQVNTIWEGTTNILALDVLRVLIKSKGSALVTFANVLTKKLKTAVDIAPKELSNAADLIQKSLTTTCAFVSNTKDQVQIETSIRQVTFALGRVVAGVLLLEQAAWALKNNIIGAEQDVVVLNQWCQDPEFSAPIKALDADILTQEAKMVFGPNAKL